MPVDSEIMTLVDLVRGGVIKSLTSKENNAETQLAVAAAIDSAFTLLALHLSNVKRQADALEALEALYLASQSPALPEFPR